MERRQGQKRPVKVVTPCGKIYYPSMLAVIEDYYPDIKSTSQLDRIIRNEQNIPHTRDFPKYFEVEGIEPERLPDCFCRILLGGKLELPDGTIIAPR